MNNKSDLSVGRSRRLALLLFVVPILVGGGILTAAGLGVVEVERLQSAWERLVGLVPTTMFSLPAAKPGSPIELDLTEEPSPYYGPINPTAADRVHAETLKDLNIIYDPGLGKAAREVAAFYATYRRLAPAGALHFMLDSAGTSYWGVRQAVAVTSDDSAKALRALVQAQVPDSSRGWYCGVGELIILDQGPARVLVVLTAQRTVNLEPIQRAATSDQPVHLDGYLFDGYTEPRLLIMGPDGDVIKQPLAVRGERFEGTLRLDEGTWQLELLATGPAGPTPIAQLTLFVDQPLPDGYESSWPSDETKIEDPSRYAIDLLNADRKLHGLPELTVNEGLSEIALAHSRDMRTTGFVGHRSPTSGMLSDRLLTAKFWSVAHGENVALNSSIADAQSGLMQSLGHRKNILSTQYTHVGLGAVPSDHGWYVTQLFSRPALKHIDPSTALQILHTRFSHQTDPDGPSPTPIVPVLRRVATEASRWSDISLVRAIKSVQREGYDGEIAGWSTRLAELEQFDVPEAFRGAKILGVGFGIHHLEHQPPPNIQVVVLVSR